MKLKMISNRKSFIFIIVLNGVLVNFIVNARTTLNVFSESTSKGESCLLHNNKAGTCVHNKDCNWLIKNLESGAMSHSQIVTCSFERNEPIVCCDASTESGSGPRNSGGKIEEACKYISEIATPFSGSNIINGMPAELAEYPHMVALGYAGDIKDKLKYDCGGTLVSSKWVLTAAHCITQRRRPIAVRMGVVILDGDDVEPEDRNIANIIRHEKYSPEYKTNDIALIELSDPVEFNDFVRPACINTRLEDLPQSDTLLITGWGSTSAKSSSLPTQLQQAVVHTVPLDQCNGTLVKFNELPNQPSLRGLRGSQMCALDIRTKNISDTCGGDSGGPLFTYTKSGVSTLVGVTSFGVSCGTELPSVYTRVAAYIDWIEPIVWPN